MSSVRDRRAPTGRLMWGMIRYAPWRYGVNVLLWVSMWLLPVIPGLLTREFFNRLEAEPGFNALTLIALFVGYGLARLMVMVVGMLNDIHFAFRTSSLLRRNMLERLYEMPGAAAVHESPGDMISRYRDDVDHVEEALSWTVDMVGTMALAIVAAIILLAIDPGLTILVFAPLVVVVAAAERMSGRIRRYRTAAREATGNITGMLGETFGSVQSIRVAGAEASTLRHFRELNDQRRRDMVRDRVLTAMLESVFWNSVNIGVGLILIIGASSMAAGTLGLGDFSLFVYFLDFVTDAGYFVGLFLAKFKQAGVSFDRMIDMLGEVDPMRLVDKRDLHLTGELPEIEAELITAGDLLDEVAAEGLTFRYPGTGSGVSEASFALHRGSFTVVTGKVGSGKTTLLRALLGLVPAQEGSITWNGEPVDEPEDFFVPPRSAYVPQVPRLFSLSLRDNLRLGRTEDDDGSLQEAIRSAAFEDDLAAMPEGLDTMVGPLGVRLSGGQVQRTATARMFARRSELLVIDDLSSALDVETERTLWQRLFTDHVGVTALVVSHRKPALLRADTILVMHEGRIVARGTYHELVATSAIFRDLTNEEEQNDG
ncbi:MAG: ABC transporter ATP-binding protein [Acidimicrobiia bacterium]